MTIIDIRKKDDEKVDKIMFSDDIFIQKDKGFRTVEITSSGENRLIPTCVITDNDQEYYCPLESKETVLNLIDALKKVIDLGWVK